MLLVLYGDTARWLKRPVVVTAARRPVCVGRAGRCGTVLGRSDYELCGNIHRTYRDGHAQNLCATRTNLVRHLHTEAATGTQAHSHLRKHTDTKSRLHKHMLGKDPSMYRCGALTMLCIGVGVHAAQRWSIIVCLRRPDCTVVAR